MAAEEAQKPITADEIALYDRQIRLWGVKAQESLRKANVLLVSMKALANEVAKNLVLAGINSLTIVDNQVVVEEDLSAQFFINESDIGKYRAEAALSNIQKLNPRVKVIAETFDISTKDQSYYEQFDLVIATDLEFRLFGLINAATRISNKPFYAAGTHGLYGFIFADLISHDYIVKAPPSNLEIKAGKKPGSTKEILSIRHKREDDKTWEIVEYRRTYNPLVLANTSPLHPFIRKTRRRMRAVSPLLPCLRAIWEFQSQFQRLPDTHSNATDLKVFTMMAAQKTQELGLDTHVLSSEFLRKFLQGLGTELAPITAMVGGLLAQDAINAIQHSEAPINNFCFFDGDSYTTPVYSLRMESFDTNGINGSATGVKSASNLDTSNSIVIE